MFQVLVFVYENYWRGAACPDPQQLWRKLSAAGFDPEEIQQALVWLDELKLAVREARPQALAVACGSAWVDAPSANSLRVYGVAEQNHLGAECLGYVRFLESAGVLTASQREIVLDRAMAVKEHPVSLDHLKIIILMVYSSLGTEPDALVLDELCDGRVARRPH